MTSTRETLPDIEFFVSCIRDALDDLKKASERKPAARRKKKA